jgi:glycosyltransferase involved in cell wall biosynthesis
VHTHLIHADLHGLIASWLAWIPVRITGRHNDDPFRQHWLMKRINNFLWKIATGGIVISDAIRQFTTQTEGAPANKVHVVRYGIPNQSFSFIEKEQARKNLLHLIKCDADTPLVGMACRLVEQKGVRYALEAFAKCAREYPTLNFVIAGEGELRDELEALADSFSLRSRVHFLGWRDDVPQILAGLDIFLMPSLWEGFGLVLLEAMSKRTPIIASNVSAIPEVIIDGETGFLVPPKDAEALAEAMHYLLGDKLLRNHLGLLAETRLETHFSVERMVDETINVYQTLLES